MSFNKMFVFSAVLIVFFSVLCVMHLTVFVVFDRVFMLQNPAWKIPLILMPFSYILSTIFIRYWWNKTTRFMYLLSCLWLGTIFFFFVSFGSYELFYLYTGTDSVFLAKILFAFTALVTVYSIINAQRIDTKNVRIKIPNLTKPLTMVHLSDIHIGTIHNSEYLKKILKKVNSVNPDLTVVTGDLFDGSGPIHHDTLLSFAKLQAPTFFSIGNHEIYEGLNKVRNTIKDLPIILLENKKTECCGLQILAINDPGGEKDSSKRFSNILNDLHIQKDKPAILMYHQPTNWDIAQTHNIDIQLSGHTHGGQIFPLTLLVKIFFLRSYGLFEKNGKYLYTSSGAGTWGPPMRLGSRSEIVVFHLESK